MGRYQNSGTLQCLFVCMSVCVCKVGRYQNFGLSHSHQKACTTTPESVPHHSRYLSLRQHLDNQQIIQRFSVESVSLRSIEYSLIWAVFAFHIRHLAGYPARFPSPALNDESCRQTSSLARALFHSTQPQSSLVKPYLPDVNSTIMLFSFGLICWMNYCARRRKAAPPLLYRLRPVDVGTDVYQSAHSYSYAAFYIFNFQVILKQFWLAQVGCNDKIVNTNSSTPVITKRNLSHA